jgi:serine/threonine protein kinase/Tfp pilus assembly protein PilF
VEEKISHYRILKKLGSGGMGEVYLAEDDNLGRTVAIKVLPTEVEMNAERLRRFINEARSASAIKHPNVASIYELGEWNGRHFIAMEYIEGETLDSHIRQNLSISEILETGIQIADALDAAHSKGIIHRDLKPANIMITPRGQVKILDFGLAKMTESFEQPSETSKLQTVTTTGLVMGTVQYMSPEQALGKTIDQRSDIFSLGVVFYQMATGRVPFSGVSATETIDKIVNSNPEAIARLNYNIPVEMEHSIRKCMEKDPNRRYQNAHDLWIDLKNLKRDTESGVTASQTKAIGSTPRSRMPLFAWITVMVFVAAVAVFLFRQKEASKAESPPLSETAKRKMIAVLPFENLGLKDDQYFAAGITEEITSRLASVQDLGVISRTSAMQYERSGKSIKQIGRELGVDYVLEGSVRWDHSQKKASRVRITPQLIRVSDDTHLWSEIYDRVMDDVFKVQSEIAQNVIEQLDVNLLSPSKKAIAVKAPTQNMEAYQEYLRGMQYEHHPDYDKHFLEAALKHFQNAIDLDPNFALPYAMAARINLSIYHEGFDPSPERINLAKKSIDKALGLDPNLPEALLSLGFYHYHGLNDYDRALEAFNKADRETPGNPEVLSSIGYVQRRQGKFRQAAMNLSKAFELDPRSSDYLQQIASIFMRTRQYAEAQRLLDQSLSLSPQQSLGYGLKWLNTVLWTGSLQDSRAVLQGMPDVVSSGPYLPRQEIFERKFQQSIKHLEGWNIEVVQEEGIFMPKDLLLARTYTLANQPDVARKYFEMARTFLEREAQKRPADLAVKFSLGRAYAGLGMKEKAIQTASLDVEKDRISKDHFMGPGYLLDVAEIYVMTGEQQKAIELLNHLLSIPSLISVPMIRLDPVWDPLRTNPRFVSMLVKYSKTS